MLNFQRFVGEGSSFEPVPVHGLYHGGEWTLPILHNVLEDCRRYDISFPRFEELKSPLRLAATGELIGARFGRHNEGIELLETALRSIFIEPINWHLCWKNITQRGDESNATVEVRVRGPVSRSLFPILRPTDASFGKVKVQILGIPEHDPVENNASNSVSSEDGVAIVGMSVNFPIGSGKDAFWASLRDGLDSVREVHKNPRYPPRLCQVFADLSHRSQALVSRYRAILANRRQRHRNTGIFCKSRGALITNSSIFHRVK